MVRNVCNVNGVLVPEEEASIPILDRGFLFGDSVYEVLRTRDGTPFAWHEHLVRLRSSAEAIALDVGLSDRDIMQRVRETTAAALEGADPATAGELYIRIIVTRGTGSAPNIDLSFAPGPATAVLIVRPLPAAAGKPSRLALIPRLRNDRRALDPAVKSGNYLNNVLGLAEARAAGATDCLFLNAEGFATEASTANFYAVRGDTVYTPPLRAGLLAGITRELVRACCAEAQIPFEERDLGVDDVSAADELFLTSTGRDISPVTHLDGRELHGGDAGPFTKALVQRFAGFCADRVRNVDGPRLAELLA